jgi:hypothetical protein
MTDTSEILELHPYPGHLTPLEHATVVEAHAMPEDGRAPTVAWYARYYAARGRQAVADGNLTALNAVFDAMGLWAQRLDAGARTREGMAAALVLPTDTVDAAEWSIVTSRWQVEGGLRVWLADVAPELLKGLDSADELIDRIREQAK